MGAAVGHLKHLTEDLDLSFGELVDTLESVFVNNQISVSEKIDGMNLVFSWDALSDKIRAARSVSEINNIGLGSVELAKKFTGRAPSVVEHVFVDAFETIERALLAIPYFVKTMLFGTGMLRWMSLEIVHSSCRNTIHYDGNHIVFHKWPVLSRNVADKIERVDGANTIVPIINASINEMQQKVWNTNWKLHCDVPIEFGDLDDITVCTIQHALSEIKLSAKKIGLTPDNTLRDYVQASSKQYISEHIKRDIGDDNTALLAMKLADHKDAPNANVIKKRVSAFAEQEVATIMREREQVQRTLLSPIDKLISTVSSAILSKTGSSLVSDHPSEVNRLRREVVGVIEHVQETNNQEAIKYVRDHLNRLGKIENINTDIEGVVFTRGDSANKVTGSFAPVHQIVALSKFGRKGIIDGWKSL